MERRSISEEARDTTLVVVLGMHRSGTSAITRAMETMGADFGSRLMPAVAGVNDKGFFEDLDIVAINMEIMAAAGTDWHALAPVELDTISPQQLDQLQTKALAILREKCTAKTFALKDPRIARLLPFWQPVFACLGMRVVYVIAIRNPISVAQSLARRNQFPEAKTYLLWLAHMLPALTMTRDSERVLVDYDKLLDSPVEELTRISAKLALPLNPKSVAEFEQEFLDNELRHTRYASQDLNLIRSAPRQVKELFAAAESACRDDDRSTPALDVSIASAQRYLDDIAPLLRFEWQVDLQVQQFHRTHAESGAQIRRLDDALTERSGQLGDAERALADRNRKIEELDSALVNRNQQLEGLENALAERSRQLESLNNALEDRNRRIRELENALHDLNATHAQLEHLSGEHRSQQEIIHSLEQTLAAQGTELSRCAEIIKQTRESTSWRVTAPLRALRKSLSARKA